MTAPPAVFCEQLSQVYRDAEGTEVVALDHVDLLVQPGAAVALVGPSGAGKSTLLTLLAGLVKPTSGRVVVDGHDVGAMTERELLRLRASTVGMVLQTPGRNLLPYASALANVRFAQRSGRGDRDARRAAARELLDAVGLSAQADVTAGRLSGGQQQRLAVAVGLAGQPTVVLADEPTSQLDRASGDEVLQLLLAARRDRGTTLVVVTHDHRVSEALDAEYTVHDGRLRQRRWLRFAAGEQAP